MGIDSTDNTGADHLRSLIERIEWLMEERKSLASDIKDIKDEAKSAGFDVKVMNRIIKERAMDAAEVREFDAVLATYRKALGMLQDTPLGQAAMPAAPAKGEKSVKGYAR